MGKGHILNLEKRKTKKKGVLGDEKLPSARKEKKKIDRGAGKSEEKVGYPPAIIEQ